MAGDIPGMGLEHGYTRTNAFSCGKDCNDKSQCKSFLFSPSKNWCKLMREGDPTGKEPFEDYQFCSKIGKYLYLNNIYLPNSKI